MRKNFLKELSHLKTKDALGGSNNQSAERLRTHQPLASGGKKLSKLAQGQLAAFQ
jgi:hypothetical protein